MLSLEINNGPKDNLVVGEGVNSNLACVQVNDEVFALNAAQASAVVNFLQLMLEGKEQYEDGGYKYIRDNHA